VTAKQQRSATRASIAAAMHGRSSHRPAPVSTVPRRGRDGRVAPEELHRWRTEWGNYYGSRIRELTNDWKRELL
jgi:hypothetical protein